jgi:PAS domain S-box-containing protein
LFQEQIEIMANHTNTSKSAPEGEGPSNYRIFRDGRELSADELPVQLAAATGHEVRDCEYTIVFDDGSSREIFGSAVPLLDERGKVRGAVSAYIDITERKRAEKQLQATANRLQAILDNAPVGIVVGNRQYRFVESNAAFQRMVGYSADELKRMDWKALTHPDDIARNAELVDGLMQGKLTNYELEKRYVLKDGKRIWIRSIGARLDEEHKISIIEDITERKRAEEALRNSEERFQLAARATRDIVWDWDIVNDCVWFSEHFFEVFGYDRATFPAGVNGWAELVHPQDSWVIPFNEATYASEEYRLRRADGTWAYVRDRKYLVRDANGNPVRKIGVITDITENKRAEAALAESEERFRTIVDLAPDGIFIVAADTGRLIEVNQAACEQVGCSREQLLQRTLFDIVAPRLAERAAARLRGELPPGSHESAHVRTDGVEVPLELSVSRITLGGCSAFLGIARDISDRKRAEEQRGKLEQQLRQAQKMEAVGRLAGGIAHDFNNSLTVIRSYTELLQDSLPAQDTLRKNTQEIIKAADRAATLTRQMLAYSRKQILSPVVLDLKVVINETAKMLKRIIGADIELRVSSAEPLWAIKADPDQIVQILMNLCVNARDAMPQGGTLTIATGNVTVEKWSIGGQPNIPPGDYVRLSVTDTGTGIRKEIQEHIFDPFFTTKDVGKGTGLGLAMVYGTVKQSGGYVWVDSELGQGACFTIFLPMVNGAIVPEISAQPEVRSQGIGTILVTEVEDLPREVVCGYLRSAGYTVLAAGSGKEALAVASQHEGNIDLLVTDLVMPGMSGRELAQMLESLRLDLKTIYMSGYSDDAVLRRSNREQGPAFLQKPYSLDALARKVRDTLGRTETVQ